MAKKLTLISGASVAVSPKHIIPASTDMLQALFPPRASESWDQTARFNEARAQLLTDNPGAIISFKMAGLDRMPASVQPGMCFDACDITSVSWDLVPKEVMTILDFSKAVVESRLRAAAFLPETFGRG